MQKYLLIGIFVIIAGFIVFSGRTQTNPSITPAATAQATHIEGDIQYIDITAVRGYSPSRVVAKAGMKTVLVMNTVNDYDCSSAFMIPSLGIRGQLPITGEKRFDIPPQSAGTGLKGVCQMGMYSLDIKFN